MLNNAETAKTFMRSIPEADFDYMSKRSIKNRLWYNLGEINGIQTNIEGFILPEYYK